jgi:hypothetical protein
MRKAQRLRERPGLLAALLTAGNASLRPGEMGGSR